MRRHIHIHRPVKVRDATRSIEYRGYTITEKDGVFSFVTKKGKTVVKNSLDGVKNNIDNIHTAAAVERGFGGTRDAESVLYKGYDIREMKDRGAASKWIFYEKGRQISSPSAEEAKRKIDALVHNSTTDAASPKAGDKVTTKHGAGTIAEMQGRIAIIKLASRGGQWYSEKRNLSPEGSGWRVDELEFMETDDSAMRDAAKEYDPQLERLLNTVASALKRGNKESARSSLARADARAKELDATKFHLHPDEREALREDTK